MRDHANGSWHEYTEREAELADGEARRGERPHMRMPVVIANGGRRLLPPPSVTPEQAAACSWQLLERLLDLCNVVSERGLTDDLVVSSSVSMARNAIRKASKWKEPVDGVA